MKNKILIFACLLLVGCSADRTLNDQDPYQSLNRKVYKFNKAVDATLFKPTAKIYHAILPPQVQNGIRNAFHNIHMLPTVANDILQGEFIAAYKDSWRLFINTTLGVGGLFDVASKWGLPYQPNDLGLTFAKWGDEHSPYLVLPIFGPSTFRDAVGLTFDFSLFSIYPHIKNDDQLYGLVLLNMLQVRADLLDTDSLTDEALDEYTFVRDAYLQHRQHQLKKQPSVAAAPNSSSSQNLYIDSEDEESLLADETLAVGVGTGPAKENKPI